MNKRVVLIVLMALAVGAGVATAAPTREETTGPVTLDFWHIWGGARVEPLNAVIADFERLNPGILVTSNLHSSAGLNEKQLTALAGGTAPDVMMTRREVFYLAAEADKIVPLDGYLSSHQVDTSDWYPAALEASEWNGRYYGLPSVISGPWLLYWNKGLFEQAGLDPERPPEDWNQWGEAIRKTTTFDDAGRMKTVGFWDSRFEPFLAMNGGKVLTGDGRTAVVDSRNALETLEFMVRLANDIYRDPERLFAFLSTDAEGGQLASTPFYNDMTAMKLDGPHAIAQLAQNAPALEYGIAPVPVGPSGNRSTSNSLSVVWHYTIPENSSHRDEAFKFLLYISHGQGKYDFMKAQERPSAIIAHNEDPSFSEGFPFWDVIQTVMREHTVQEPKSPVWNQITAILRDRVDLAVNNRQSPQDALAAAQAEIMVVLAEYSSDM